MILLKKKKKRGREKKKNEMNICCFTSSTNPETKLRKSINLIVQLNTNREYFLHELSPVYKQLFQVTGNIDAKAWL